MKFLIFFTLGIISAVSISCEKQEDNDPGSSDVDHYIGLLKEGAVESFGIPSFTSGDIPDLLKYRNDTLRINTFPVNPISSFAQQDCRLGMIALWMIESVRAVANNSPFLVATFPSQNPILYLKNDPEGTWVFDDQSHQIAAEAYYDWWSANRRKPFDDYREIDPLENTPYAWH